MRKINFLAIALMFFSLTAIASAEENTKAPNSADFLNRNREIRDIRDNVRNLKVNAAEQQKEDRATLNREIRAVKQQEGANIQLLRRRLEGEVQSIKTNPNLTPEDQNRAIIKKREEANQLLQNKIKEHEAQLLQKKEEFQNEIKVKSEEVRTKIEEQKAEFQKKLANIKDKRKKEAVQRINDQLHQLSQNQINNLARIIDNINQVLKNIISRTNKAELSGKDVSVVKSDIQSAVDAVAAFRDALKVQAGKTYTINVTTEKTLQSDTKQSREALFNDLKVLRDKAKYVRETVVKAATDLSKIQNINSLEGENAGATNQNQ